MKNTSNWLSALLLTTACSNEAPIVRIDEPTTLQEVAADEPVDFVGQVLDVNQSPDSLEVQWVVIDDTTLDQVAALGATVDDSGRTVDSWSATAVGPYTVQLIAIDDADDTTVDEVSFVVIQAQSTPNFDDDGDCFCEVAPCSGSVEPSCELEAGDCDDGNAQVHPGMPDAPSSSFVDDNCDGIDGDLLDLVFLDPTSGDDGSKGLAPTDAVKSWTAAAAAAAASGRSWVAVAEGRVDMRSDTASFVEGLNVAGGYLAAADWARGSAVTSTFAVPAEGEALVDWQLPTTFQLVDFVADDGLEAGDSSIVLRIQGTAALLLDAVGVVAGLGADGADATGLTDPSTAGQDGIAGGWSCDQVSRGGQGGAGGRASCGDFCSCSQSGGSAGSPGTNGGAAPGRGGGACQPGQGGDPGNPGAPGDAGAGGEAAGLLSAANGYQPADGAPGTVGEVGQAGGGGGGGGGCGVLTCSPKSGGNGGRGGGAGCAGQAGEAGTGGGASIGLLLEDSRVVVIDARVSTSSGGTGGAGAAGQPGGAGGTGQAGGGSGGGTGGRGGNGGDGGDGGHGGGGGGGPSFGAVCVGSSVLDDTRTTWTIGSGGEGGTSPGNPGVKGEDVDLRGCP